MTYSKLANLNVINTERLLLLGGTQAQCGDEFADEVERAEDQTCAEEGVCAAGEGVSELVAELDPVVVQPAAIDDGVSVQMRNVVSGEEGSQNVSNEAANAVDCKDVERVVAAEEVLELGGIVAGNTSTDAKDDSSPGWDVA